MSGCQPSDPVVREFFAEISKEGDVSEEVKEFVQTKVALPLPNHYGVWSVHGPEGGFTLRARTRARCFARCILYRGDLAIAR